MITANPTPAIDSTGVVDIGRYLKQQLLWVARMAVWYGMGAGCIYCSSLYAAQLQGLPMVCCWISGGCLYIVGTLIEEPWMSTAEGEPPR